MKSKKSNLALTKAFFILLVMCCFSSCNYSEKTLIEFNSMKNPITLQYKQKATFWYSVTLKDGDGKIHDFGNSSSLANWIGETYQIGDTIRK